MPADGKRILSDAQGVAITIPWSPVWNLAALLPWAVFLVILASRTWSHVRNLAVLFPMLLVQGVLSVLEGNVESIGEMFPVCQAFAGFALGLGIVFLLLDSAPRHGSWGSALRMGLVPGAMGVLAAIVASAPDVGQHALVATGVVLVAGFLLAGAIRLAAWRLQCGGSPLGFLFFLFMGLSAIPALTVVAVGGAAYLVFGGFNGRMGDVWANHGEPCAALGPAIFGIAFPFMMLVFYDDWFYDRFRAFLGVEESAAAPRVAATQRRRRKLGRLM